MSEEDVKGYLAVSPERMSQGVALNSAFKSEVNDKPIKFPKEVGAEHPFDFEKVEQITDNMGIANAAVDKTTDSIIGDFTIKVNDSKAQKLLDQFIKDSNLLTHIRPWIKEGISKGNGAMDLTDFKNSKIRTINFNNLYVKRTRKGVVKEFNQVVGNTKTISAQTKTISFSPNQIAHLKINANPGAPYGMGIIWPNRRTLEHYSSAEISGHKLQERKAGAPMHVKVGIPGESVNSADVDAVNDKLKYMNNCTEWATDANVDISVLDFGNITEASVSSADHDVEQFAIGTQIPLVILGKANIPEGLAKTQLEAFQRYIHSIRIVIEEIIEDQILKPFLETQGLSADIDFEWELPGEEEKNKRITSINEILKNPFISEGFKAALEMELAVILGLDEEVEGVIDSPEDAEKKAEEDRRKEEEEIKQPEVPGEKPTAKEEAEINFDEKTDKEIEKMMEGALQAVPENSHTCTEECSCNLSEEASRDMTLAEYVNITEIPGFNFTDYLIKILQRLKTDKFSDLKALTERDIDLGLLSESDVDKLRLVLKDGFQKNKTIREIEKEIDTTIDLRDRIKIEDGVEKITLSKEERPLVIARTETVRLANAGLKDLYQENDVSTYRYLAAMDERTSDICASLNGQVFLTKDGQPGVNMPPMHVNCRSTIVGLVE